MGKPAAPIRQLADTFTAAWTRTFAIVGTLGTIAGLAAEFHHPWAQVSQWLFWGGWLVAIAALWEAHKARRTLAEQDRRYGPEIGTDKWLLANIETGRQVGRMVRDASGYIVETDLLWADGSGGKWYGEISHMGELLSCVATYEPMPGKVTARVRQPEITYDMAGIAFMPPAVVERPPFD